MAAGASAIAFICGCFSQSGSRFLSPTHFAEDIGEQQILPGLIGLPRYGAALSLASFFQPVLTNAEKSH